MNYYEEIKNKIIDDEVYQKVKDYSKEQHRVKTYFEIGKLLSDAGKHYGENIIGEYAKRLEIDFGKKYNKRTLFRIRQFYTIFANEKVSAMWTQLSWSHIRLLLSLKTNMINYYIYISIYNHISVRELENKIKSKEYERLSNKTKEKLINNEKDEIQDFIKHPIIIRNPNNIVNISEKVLQQLIIEDIPSFLKQLGSGFSFIENEYKIMIGNVPNYIDILLFNIKYNCYVVIELKVTEVKKEHIGQIQVYMNYIDKNLKTIYQNNTIGIIIARKENKFVIEYSSDERIFETTYLLNK